MKIFEKYKNLFNACRKYPEITLSKRQDTKPLTNFNYYNQFGIDNNNVDENQIPSTVQNTDNIDDIVV